MDTTTARTRIRILASTFFAFLYTFTYDGLAYSAHFGDLFAQATVASLIGVAFLAAIVFVATRNPAALSGARLSTAAALCILLGALLIIVSEVTAQSLSFTAGLALVEVGFDWSLTVAFLALSTLERRQIIKLACIAIALAYVSYLVLELLPFACMLAALLLSALLTLLPVLRPTKLLLEELRSATPPDELRITQPKTWVPLLSGLFVCMLVLMVFYGYGCSEVVSAGIVADISTIVFAAGPVALVFAGAVGLDTMYLVSTLLALLGAMLSPVGGMPYETIATIAFRLAAICFYLLQIITWGTIAQRNRQSALPLVAWGNVLCIGGNVIGCLLRAGMNTLYGDDPNLGFAVFSVLVVMFVGYVLLGLRSFSLEATVMGIEAEKPVVQSSGAGLESLCQDVALRFGLTKRESEVLVYLARGRNCGVIEKELCISRNTVRTHVKHIYEKLCIHSQQELIDLVDSHGSEVAPKSAAIRHNP